MKTKRAMYLLAACLISSFIIFQSGCSKDKKDEASPTPSTPPTSTFNITTRAIMNITETTATSGGSVTAQNSEDVIQRGVCWSTSPKPTVKDSHTIDSTGTGSFTSYLNGLLPGTTYYLRAYASDSVATILGNQVEFTTLGGGNTPVDFTASPNSGAAPLSVEFTDLSTINPESWQWDFGDGGTSTQQNPSYTYYEAGSYSVQLIVYNGSGSDTLIKDNYITVNGGGPGEPCPGIPTVYYEGKTYNTVEIGDQCWFKENLNVGTMINGEIGQTNNGEVEKYCYDNDPANCDEYGGLYQWDETMQYTTLEGAQGICPAGWHIPTDDEWKILEGTVDSQYGIGDPIWNNTGIRGFDAGKMLKSTNGWNNSGNGDDAFGFRVIPAGIINDSGLTHAAMGYYGLFWSSTKVSSISAIFRKFGYDINGAIRGEPWFSDGISVRCLKDN